MRLDRITKYVNFYLVEKKAKTGKWVVINNTSNAILAEINWHSPWRQYIIEFNPDAFFNDGCLKDIYDFLQALRNKEVTIEGVK